jgi:hypothetical protein
VSAERCNECGWLFEEGADIIDRGHGYRTHRTCPRDWPLMGKVLQLPSCGCKIDGAGTLPNPVRIIFCAAHAAVQIAFRMSEVREAIVAGILVLRTRDGLPVTDEQARERANNILTALQGMEIL